MTKPALCLTLFTTLALPALPQRGNWGGGGRGHAGPGVSAQPGGRHGAWQGRGHAGAGNVGGWQHRRPSGIITYPAPPRTWGSPHGFGNVVFPGTGHAPGTYSPFSIVDPSFGTRLSNTVSGFGYPYNSGYGYGAGYGYSGYGGNYAGQSAVIVPYLIPYSVPVYVQSPPPQVIYVVPGEPDRSLTTSVHQPSRESVVTYVAPSRTEAVESMATERFYLIALKNHSIYSATDYWVQDKMLHYLTNYGARHYQVPLDEVDLAFSTQLNRERGQDFRLDKTTPR